ncbi:MAG: hypothetical protein K0S38_671 [Candidatus Paceibacter sp.]|nr:hypothetical protein [Candidatus Paceibacter sp.]
MKKYLYGGTIGMIMLGFVFTVAGPKTASAHGFVPHFQTMGVTEVTSNSAVLTGVVDSMHSSWNGHAWFEYGTNPYSGNYGTSWPWKAGVRGIPWIGTTDMRTTITGLKPNTTYYFHMLAENKNGKNTSEVMSFRTKSDSKTTSQNTNYQKPTSSSTNYTKNTTNNTTVNTNITTNNTTNQNYNYSTNNYSNYYSNTYTYQYLQYQNQTNNQSSGSQNTSAQTTAVYTYQP